MIAGSRSQIMMLAAQAAADCVERIEYRQTGVGQTPEFYITCLGGMNHKWEIDSAFRELREIRKRPYIEWVLQCRREKS